MRETDVSGSGQGPDDTRDGVPGAGAGAVTEALHAGDATEDTTVLRAVRDLHGLVVEDAGGLTIGELYGALAEADTGLLRYVDLSLNTLDRHVLVPIGHARVLEDDAEPPRVRLRAALLEELEQIPPFPADVSGITDPFERALLEAYGRSFHGERYYAHPAFDHRGVYAGEHPVMTDDGDPDDPDDSLKRLSYLPGWRVAEGERDIRGWPLRVEGRQPLEVTDLIVDRAARKVRYVVIAVRDGASARLLPIGYLQIDVDGGNVTAPGLTHDDLLALPAYDGGGVDRADEERLAAALRQTLGPSRRYLLADFRPDRRTSRS
jgi:hypothetical protein